MKNNRSIWRIVITGQYYVYDIFLLYTAEFV